MNINDRTRATCAEALLIAATAIDAARAPHAYQRYVNALMELYGGDAELVHLELEWAETQASVNYTGEGEVR